MSGGFYGAAYDKFVQRTDDSKSHKLKSAYWTTKQAMINKFGRKQDENIVASDADLDAKLELLKSVQTTSRNLSVWLARYQDTVCYLSQAENEMGRFLKQHSLEDKTQAGKIMSAVGKALSHSAQQRLLLRAPLDRLQQEVKTFRQRAISDTMSTLKRMETSRTEYRGALLWMKNVSEELDPDTYKQLEKFRCVQAQVRKNKAVFDRLKIDSMQKIDLLSASRCNMLSHVLAAYQNSLLNFLERTSRTMVAVAERYKGYQYYEFNVLKHLRPDSRKLAGRVEESGEDDSASSDEDLYGIPENKRDENADGVGCAHTPPDNSGMHARQGYSPLTTVDESELRWEPARKPEHRSNYPDTEQDANTQPGAQPSETNPTEEELDRQLDELFRTADAEDCKQDDFDQFQSFQSALSSSNQPTDLLAGADGGVPAEHRDFLTDLFATDNSAQPNDGSKNWLDQILPTSNGQNSAQTSFTTEWNSVFAQLDVANSPRNLPPVSGVMGLGAEQPVAETERDPWAEFELSGSSVLPSQLLEQQQLQSGPGGLPMGNSVLAATNAARKGQQEPAAALPSNEQARVPQTSSALCTPSQPEGNRNQKQPTNLDAWMSLFSDLGPLGNPDSLSKKEGQITDA